MNKFKEQDCSSVYNDPELNEGYDNFFTFTQEGKGFVKIRRFTGNKLLVYLPSKYLANFKCYEDGLTADGKKYCDDSIRKFNGEFRWRIDKHQNRGNFLAS